MEPLSQHLSQSTDHVVGDYWTDKFSVRQFKSACNDSNHHAELSQLPEHHRGDCNSGVFAREQMVWPGDNTDTAENQNRNLASKPPENAANSKVIDGKDCMSEHSREEIELQLATLTGYIRNKRFLPIQWTCCSCATKQNYREHLEALDGLRCQYPRCGVSDKGFRIYRVHDMCARCTVLVDQRAPVTKKSLKKKRDEVREVLKKIRKVYEDVDRLVEFDEKEAERMAGLIEARETKEDLEREKQEADDLHRAELMEQKRNTWVDGGVNAVVSGSIYDEKDEQSEAEAEATNSEEGEFERRRVAQNLPKVVAKPQKRRGLKSFLRL